MKLFHEYANGWCLRKYASSYSAFGRHALPILCLVFFWLTLGPCLAEQRFPPPQFENGYKLPETTTPAARSLIWQYIDVLVLLAALGVATFLIYRKRSRTGLVALSIFSLAYFGFYRNGCVCAIGSIQNVAFAFGNGDYRLPLTIAAFFILPIVFALFVGRAFCAGVCPHGALQDLLLVKPIKIPAWLEQALGVVPFIYLGASVLFAATGSAFLICRYDPFVPLFRMGGSFLMLGVGAAFVVTSLFVGRPYCRFLCPYGALLRLGGTVSKWRVTVTPNTCTQCRLCEESCPYGALQKPVPENVNAPSIAADRKRLAGLVLLLPIALLAGGWVGSLTAAAFSQMHPTVALAEKLPGSSAISIQPGTQSAAELSLARAQQDPTSIVASALEIQERFVTGGWILGAWIALVVGAKLVSLSIRRTQHDYEPDRGACLACARCFASCPNELIRRGCPTGASISQTTTT